MNDFEKHSTSTTPLSILFGGGRGSDGEKTFEQLIQVLNNVYLGVIENQSTKKSLLEKYPHCNDFYNSFRKFCQYSTLCKEQLKESQLTNNLPNLDYEDTEPKEYSKDETIKKLVNKFIKTCTDVIRDVLEVVQKKSKPNLSNDGPLSEIAYWREVSSKYGSVWEQVKDTRVQYLREVLEYEEFTSTLEIFDSQFQELTKNCLQSRDNVKFLETLERYFKSINRCSRESLIPIMDIIPSLMRALRMVWIISRFYNTEKQMRPLMKLIDNDIVKKVKQYVNIQELVFKICEDPKESIKKLNGGINLLQKWKDSYFNVRMEGLEATRSKSSNQKHHPTTGSTTSGVRWEFNIEKLFRDSDHLKKLLIELRKVSEGILQCKLNSMFLSPEIFSGSIGTVEGIEQLLEEIQGLVHPFQSIVKMNAGRPAAPELFQEWEIAFSTFKENYYRVERKIEDFISQTFEKLSSSQRAFKLLQEVNEHKRSIGGGLLSSSSFGNRSVVNSSSNSERSFGSSSDIISSSGRSGNNNNTLDIMKGKRAQILERFGRELDDIEQIFHREKLNPPKPKNMPETVSRIFWSNSLFEKIRATIFSMKPNETELVEMSHHNKKRGNSKKSSNRNNNNNNKSKIKVGEVIKESIEGIFSETETGKKVKSRCIRITKMIKEYEKEVFCNWSERVEREARECLKKNILCGNYTKLKDLRVNFDTRLMLMVQETKYLDRILGDTSVMMEESSSSSSTKRRIPDIAMNITLQSDKYHHYIEELQMVISKISQTLGLLGKHEMIVLRPKLQDLVETLKPGFTMLNWNSLGIKAFIRNCNLEINSFQGIVKKLQKNVTVLNNIINQIRSTNLFIDPKELEGRQLDLNRLYQIIDEHKCEKMKYVKKKYKVLCQTLMKIESELLSTNILEKKLQYNRSSKQQQQQQQQKGKKQKKNKKQRIQSNGRCSLLKDYYYFIERKLFRGLMRMHLNTLKVFHIFRKTEGIVKVEFSLVQNEICETPERDEIDNMLEKIMNNFLNATKEITRFMEGTCIPITSENINLQYLGKELKSDSLSLEEKNPFLWVNESGWKDLNKLSNEFNVFKNIIRDISINEKEWKEWYNNETPENINYPQNYTQILSPFQSLCLLRCLRVDRILKSVTKFITLTMKSNHFVRPPILNYRKIFKQSSNVSPIVCMIAPGYDPADDILKLAEKISQRCYYISLGQGMEEKAKELIERGMSKGQWVLLQNCHLLIDWMKEVEKIINSMDKELVHNKFRLWMTSEVSKEFPISILQRSLKIVTEPPNSLKLNMVTSYSNLTNDQLRECPHASFKQLIFVLTYFHAILQERKKYGKYGWNVPYDFNNSDYLVSFSLLKTYLKKAHDSKGPVPWASLKYLVGEAMYGGRVTDDFDRRILVTYLNEFMGEFLFDTFQPFHFFTNEQIDYKLPITVMTEIGSPNNNNNKNKELQISEKKKVIDSSTLEKKENDEKNAIDLKKQIQVDWNHKKYCEYIEKNIKLENPPEVVGLHSNAEIGYLTSCSQKLWCNLILLQENQTQSTSSKSEKEEEEEEEGEDEEEEENKKKRRKKKEKEEEEEEEEEEETSSKELISLKMIEDLEILVPSNYLIDRIALKKRIGDNINPIQVVLLQEVERWNILVETIRENLFNLRRALIGDIPMSKELENNLHSLLNGQIPNNWRKCCPKTQKKLSDWLQHFKRRFDQYSLWVKKNEDPPVIWISGLHVPESYLTSIVQVTCKKYKWPLDKTVLFSEVTKLTEEPKEKPKDGCYVKGLFLEGASWDIENHVLKEQDPKVLVVKLPIIKITPIEVSKLKTQNTFRTPVYYTSERANRAGEGLVFEVNLDTNVHDSHWILKGVAVTLNNSLL